MQRDPDPSASSTSGSRFCNRLLAAAGLTTEPDDDHPPWLLRGLVAVTALFVAAAIVEMWSRDRVPRPRTADEIVADIVQATADCVSPGGITLRLDGDSVKYGVPARGSRFAGQDIRQVWFNAGLELEAHGAAGRDAFLEGLRTATGRSRESLLFALGDCEPQTVTVALAFLDPAALTPAESMAVARALGNVGIVVHPDWLDRFATHGDPFMEHGRVLAATQSLPLQESVEWLARACVSGTAPQHLGVGAWGLVRRAAAEVMDSTAGESLAISADPADRRFGALILSLSVEGRTVLEKLANHDPDPVTREFAKLLRPVIVPWRPR